MTNFTITSAALACALTGSAVAPLLAQVRPDPRRVEIQARMELDSGQYGRSRQTFDSMLTISRTKRDSAASLFGRAFAEQQMIESDSIAPALADRLIVQYWRAMQLDPAKYRTAAPLNVALLLSSSGRHDSAASTYRRAASAGDTLRGILLLGAARELRLAGKPDAAVASARDAARHPRVAAEAQALLIDLYRETRNIAALVQLADTLRSPTAPVAELNDALAAMMQEGRWAASPWAERCLLLLARNYAALDIGPVHFTERHQPALDSAAAASAAAPIRPAIEALVDAYRLRDSTSMYTPHGGQSWWMQRTPNGDHRATWSTTLRRLGDWYARTGASRVAISFYEAALGYPSIPVSEEWVDLEALPPLPALYATLPDTGALWDRLEKVEVLTNALFSGKSAMEPGNMRRLHVVRLTLGHLFARQGRWDNDWRGAIRQLEEARRLARQIAAQSSGEPAHVAPEIYELLFAEYDKRGCTREALSIAEDLRAEYDHRGVISQRARITAEMTRLRQSSAPPPPASRCSGAGSNVSGE